MPYFVAFVCGVATGVVLDTLLEKRVVGEIQKLHASMATELQKLAAKL
ncbi:MAG: hypothetical protein M1423_09875 [Acidobacteria bacterium]|nr:hypothetical protein [Acidobacteriota bacterium]